MKPKRLKLSPENKMASSSSPPSSTSDEETINWLKLPPELMASILLRLDAVEILENAQKVCKNWYRASKDPLVWRKIDTQKLRVYGEHQYDFVGICRQAVDRSQGGLVEINLSYFGSDSLLAYIADRSSNLRRLALDMPYKITNQGLVNAAAKFPLLEELQIFKPMIKLSLKAIGHSSPKLKSLTIMFTSSKSTYSRPDNIYANEIAASMPELHHLRLIGGRLTNTGVKAILDNCSQLEHLDLRYCINVNLVGDLKKRSSQRIKVVRGPDDSTADCPLIATYEDYERERDEHMLLEYLRGMNTCC